MVASQEEVLEGTHLSATWTGTPSICDLLWVASDPSRSCGNHYNEVPKSEYWGKITMGIIRCRKTSLVLPGKSHHKEYETASRKSLNVGYAHPSGLMQTLVQTTSTTFCISLRGR